MGKRSRQPTDQIKDEILKVPEIVLDIVPKNPKHPHVANQVQPTTMQKHGSEDRKKRTRRIKMRPCQSRRNRMGYGSKFKNQAI